MNTITPPQNNFPPQVDFSHRIKVGQLLQQAFEQFPAEQQRLICERIVNLAKALDKAKQVYTLEQLTEYVLEGVEELLQHEVEWPKISCKAGCAHCCHIHVDITKSEAVVMVDYAKENGIEIDTTALKAQEGLSIGERPKHKYSKCVFLDDDNRCKVYAVRPFNCRKYMVQTEPKFCDVAAYPNYIVGINFAIQAEMLLAAYHTIVDQPEGNMSTMLLAELPNKLHNKIP